MAKASDNPFPSLLLVEQAAAPAAPAAGQARLYRGTDNKLYIVDDGGTATEVGGGSAAAMVGCKVKRSAAFDMTAGAVNGLPWDAEFYDTDGFHDNATNNTRLTIPTGLGGYYTMGGCIVPSTPIPDGTRVLAAIRVNGTTIVDQNEIDASGSNSFPSVKVGTDHPLAAGDYVEFCYFISAGPEALDLGPSHFYLRKVG